MKHSRKVYTRNNHNKTRRINKLSNTSNNKQSMDDKIGKICATGQYSTYSGNFYNNKVNKEKIAEFVKKIKEDNVFKKLKTHKERYTRFLNIGFKHTDTIKAMTNIKDDYYGYCNDQWFKANDIDKGEKKYYVQVDNFRIEQEKVYYKLIEYVNAFIKANPTSKKAKCINNVYKSLRDNTLTATRRHITEAVSKYDKFITENDLYGLLASFNSNETISWCSPITWAMTADEKDVTKYISHINLGQLGIYDYMIYISDLPDDTPEINRYKKRVKKEYLHYINEIFTACIGKNHGYKPADVWDVELELMNEMGCDEKLKSDPNSYNKLSSHDIVSKTGFDWPLFAKKLGFKTTPKYVIVGNPNGLKCTTKMLKERWNTPTWKTFWLFSQFKQMVRFEVSLRHIHYNFYNKFLEGAPAIMPSEIYPLFGLSLTFNTFLSEQYVEHNYNPLYVNYTTHMVEDLRELFLRKLAINDWLAPSTKKAAIRKMKKLKLTVGKPETLRYDPEFAYVPDDPLYNISLLLDWKHKRYIELDGKPIIDIPIFDWSLFKMVGTQCYMVNAYYLPNKNSIYVPLAYLQKPFIDLEERGLEYNSVYIGYTVAHELSHALDNTGSKFDEDGNLNNWWTDADRSAFNKKVKDVVKQYELYASRDGITFNADESVGEDIADISGMALIEEYLLDNQIINDEPIKMKKMNLAKLYMNFAIQGRQKIYKQAVRAQLKMNPHPLEKYRVNCALSRLELFKTIYGIKKGDGMWWNNDTFW